MGYLGTCYPCAGITNRALQTWEGQIRCVERDNYINSGWGPRTGVPETLLLERCDVDGCQKCEANYLTCTECTAGKVLNLNKCSANTPTPAPNTSGASSTPAFVSVLSNTFGLTFGPNQSRTIHAVEVRDLNTQTLFSCAQLDCKYSWKGALLRISFTPSVTVTDGDIIIPNIKLTQTPGYIGWVTTGQVLLFLLRTVGSVLLFPKYPKLAMLPDLLITMSFILCAFLGPVILIADSAFELVGQIKILWFRMDSLVENWDTDTLSLSTAPNTWKYPIFCGFLDNYSQNTVGFLALALLLTVAGYLARRVTQNKQSSPRLLAIATIVEKHYGTKFWLAKMYANSLEIMLYSLISFDKADASSKSIIGIMLAAVFVGAQVWLAVGATLITVNQSGTTDFTETARPYEQRPDTIMMTETHPLSTSSPPQTKFTEKAFRALGFGWQQMPSSNLKKVSRSKGFLETAFFFRNLGICLTILKIASSPQAQLIVAMCLQFIYLSYFIYCNVYLKKLEFVATLSLEAMMLVVILFKTLSTTPSTSESNLQNTLGALLLVALTVSIILTIGSFGLALMWNWSSQEKDALESTSFKPCTRTQPNPNGAVSSPAEEVIPSNLKIIIEDHPKPSVGEEVLEQGMSMHSIPNEGENAQIDFGSIPVTEPQSI